MSISESETAGLQELVSAALRRIFDGDTMTAEFHLLKIRWNLNAYIDRERAADCASSVGWPEQVGGYRKTYGVNGENSG